MKAATENADLVREVLEKTREIVTARILELEKGLKEIDLALENAVPQNPMEDDSYREKLAEERLHLHGSLSRKESLLRHLKRMPVSCGAFRVTSESVVLTEDKNILVIVPEADGESFVLRNYNVSLMSTQAPLFQEIKDLHPGDIISWKNGHKTVIRAVC